MAYSPRDIQVNNISSIIGAADVTPNDSADLPKAPARGFMFTGSGNLKVTLLDGSVHTLIGMETGVAHPWSIVRVWATDTTATGIKALY